MSRLLGFNLIAITWHNNRNDSNDNNNKKSDINKNNNNGQIKDKKTFKNLEENK